MLDRRLLFRGGHPDVRTSPLKMFDSREVMQVLSALLAEKMRHSNDEYFEFKHFEGKRAKLSDTLHVAFVGDSRIRQLFAMFMTVTLRVHTAEANCQLF